MNVSVVICAYTLDRWHDLEASVQSCFNQTKPPAEVVVVIDYNEDLFRRAVAAFADAHVVRNRSTKGLSGARNSGVAVSSSEILAFLDDDAFADSRWLEELIEPFEDPQVCGTGGWVVPSWEAGKAMWFPETFYWVLGCSYSGLPLTDAPIRNPIGASMAIRRCVFDAIGGFNPDIGRIGVTPLGCEETELCIRYAKVHPGERFMLAHRAVVHHRVPTSRLNWRYFRRRCWSEGLSKAAVSSLVGSESGLASERTYVLVALPQELRQNFRRITREPLTALTKASLIIAGTLITGLGYVKGALVLRYSPLRVEPTSLPYLDAAMRDASQSENGVEPLNDWQGPAQASEES